MCIIIIIFIEDAGMSGVETAASTSVALLIADSSRCEGEGRAMDVMSGTAATISNCSSVPTSVNTCVENVRQAGESGALKWNVESDMAIRFAVDKTILSRRVLTRVQTLLKKSRLFDASRNWLVRDALQRGISPGSCFGLERATAGKF
jgi:hypothetical protein